MNHCELDGCWLKVARANFHLKALNAAIVRFRDPATNVLFNELDAATGEHVILVDAIDPPETWSAEIGNVLYNLHSSLDHLAWQLATRARYGEPPRSGARATFPIFKNRGEFWARSRNGSWRPGSGAHSLRQFPADARRMILDVQPYKDGDRAPQNPLWLLHTLSNEDKHKTLHAVGTAVLQSALSGTGASVEHFVTNHRRLRGRAEVARLKATSTTGRLGAQFMFAETFDPATPLVGGRYIGVVLNEIARAVVNDVFGRFVPYFVCSWEDRLIAMREHTCPEYPL